MDMRLPRPGRHPESTRLPALLAGLILTAVSPACSPPETTQVPAGPVTFNRDIAPIVYKRCAPCHRPGQVAPFSLLTYEEVKTRASQIEVVTGTRYMPPWLPETGKGRFVGNRRLTVRELDLLQNWLRGELLEGDPTDLAAPPEWPRGWQLGEPDLVIRMPQVYTLPADGPDVVRNFVIPSPVDRTRYVRGVEFRPGNAPIVHHVVILVDSTGTSRAHEAKDPEPGYDGMLYNQATSPGGHFEGWTPGKGPFLRPADMAWRLDPGTDVVFQLHMLPTGKPEPIQSSLGLFFARKPPTKTPYMLRLGSKVIDIEAGDANYTIRDAYRLPVDARLLSVYPHAHYLAREMKGTARLPDGRLRWLVHIQDWDFNWQDEYRYSSPISLPAGTTLEMEYTYDNSADNLRNPHSPPRRVVYGPQSSDEMGDLWLQVLATDGKGLEQLVRDHAQRELLADVEGYEKLVRDHPEDPGFRDTLAHRYIRLGELSKAVGEWQEAIRLSPRFWAYYFNLGHALDQMKRPGEAVTWYRKTLDLKPRQARAHNNLAVALQSTGRRVEAIRHFRQALRIDPDAMETHRNLAAALAEEGNFKEAATHFRRALEKGPASVELHTGLGRALAARNRMPEAVEQFQSALRLDPNSFDARNNLGNLLAAGGRMEEALAHFRKAVELKPDSVEVLGNLGLALRMAGRFDEAGRYLEEAIRRQPGWPAPQAALAWILATHPEPSRRRPHEAIQLGRRAVRMTREQDPRMLDVLAAAYAAAGDFDQAVAAVRKAIRLVAAHPGNPLGRLLQERLDLYGRRRAYVEDEE